MPPTIAVSAYCSSLRLFPNNQVKASLKLKHYSCFSIVKANTFPCLRTSRFRVSCAAKPETVEKVCSIVRKQLALSNDTPLTPESKFVDLGADSLDTVEIVMGLEEEFEITVEEDGNQNISTVQEAADLIEKLIQSKSS